MKLKFTKSRLQAEQAAVGVGRRALLWDTELAGFGARISTKGITFVVNYWRGPIERRMTLGSLAEFGTVEAARRKAADIRLQVRAGGDPLGEIRAKRKVAESGVAVAVVVDQWMAANRSGWSAHTEKSYRNSLAKHVLPRLGGRDADSITRKEWSALLGKIRSNSPSTATLLRRILGSLLAWAADAELLTAVNLPSAKRTAPKVAPRTRVVSDIEIRAIWAASEALERRQRAFVRLVVLCRPSDQARLPGHAGNGWRTGHLFASPGPHPA